MFNFNEAERHFLDAALTFDSAERTTSCVSRTDEDLRYASSSVARLSGRLTKLLDLFGGDTTDEIVAAVASARDELWSARNEEARLRDRIVVEKYGANLTDLQAAILELRTMSKSAPPSSTFVVRARIAHAAKASGFIALFREHERQVELSCAGYERSVLFSCLPKKVDPMRGRYGRFISSSKREVR